MTDIDGGDLRTWRRSCGWSVPKTAQELRRAARELGVRVAAIDGLIRMIYAWERGDHKLTERYELLYRKLGLGPQDTPAVQERPEIPDDLSRRDFGILAGTVIALLDMLGGYPPELASRVGSTASAHTRIDSETAIGLANVVLGYRQIYQSVGAASLLDPVCGTLNLLTELAPAAGGHQDLVVSLIGQAGSLAATMLMLDQGDFPSAARYLAIAAQAARQSDDDELMAITLAARAFHSAYGGDPVDGLAFAAEAVTVAGRGIHPRTAGWVAAVASEMHATVGDEAGAMRALDAAAGQLALPMPEKPWKGIGAFNHAKLTAYRGGALMRLHRYGRAQAELLTALKQLDPVYAKHRCTAHIDLAAAYTRDGKPADAASHAISALEIVSATHHADSLRRVAALHEAIKPSGISESRELGSRLMEARAVS